MSIYKTEVVDLTKICLSFPEIAVSEDAGYVQNLELIYRRGPLYLNGALNPLQALSDEYLPEFPSVFKNVLGMAAWWILRCFSFPEDILGLSTE